MKGYLRADMYAAWKQLWLLLIFLPMMGSIAVFVEKMLFVVSSCMAAAALLPVILHQYQEDSRWPSMAVALPGGRRTYVGAKYIISVLTVGIISAIVAPCLCFRALRGLSPWEDAVAQMANLPALGILGIAISLPMSFRQNLKFSYFISFFLVFFLFGMQQHVNGLNRPLLLSLPAYILYPIALAALAISWVPSVLSFEKREF